MVHTVGAELSKQFGSCDNGIYMYIIAKRLCVCLQLVIIHGTPCALAIHGTEIISPIIFIIAVSRIIPIITHTPCLLSMLIGHSKVI